ncbi:AFG2-interacting ribosome maturation factor-like [Amphiura filiformis]|uniref:AFG2-interacting ribosome maturation factor-like n=1 Tax=Amphiura filiformis TaxID=82378 RepID=UPI003B21CC54
MPAEDTIYKQMLKAYKSAEQQISLLQESIQECQSLVESLSNLAEQLQCCRCAAADHESVLLLTAYPDLPGRMEVKLVQSMEGILCKLQGKLETLQSARTKLYYQYTHALSSYQKISQEFGVQKATQRTATWPSIVDMLQWLWEIDRQYASICANRQWILDTLSYDRLGEIQALPSRWKLNSSDKNFFQDILAHVSFFMADVAGHS